MGFRCVKENFGNFRPLVATGFDVRAQER
jgi:hypothetical protein